MANNSLTRDEIIPFDGKLTNEKLTNDWYFFQQKRNHFLSEESIVEILDCSNSNVERQFRISQLLHER